MNRSYIRMYHKIMEIAGYIFIIISIIVGVVYANSAGGQQVPTHFDIHGNPDQYGSPWTILIMPIMMMVVCAIISISLHLVKPTSWNMPVKVTESNAPYLYRDVADMFAIMIVEFAVFALVETILATVGKSGNVALPIVLVSIVMVTTFGSIARCVIDGRK